MPEEASTPGVEYLLEKWADDSLDEGLVLTRREYKHLKMYLASLRQSKKWGEFPVPHSDLDSITIALLFTAITMFGLSAVLFL